MKLDRRTVLSTGAAVATSTAIAGCLDGSDSDGETTDDGQGDGGNDGGGESLDIPSYARWLAWDEDEQATVYMYADWANLEDVEGVGVDAEEWQDGSGPEDGPLNEEDPMLALPMTSVLFVGFVGAVGLLGTGLTGLLSTGAEEELGTVTGVTDFETTIDELLVVNDASVMIGDVDADEIRDALTEEPEEEWSFKTEYEQTDRIDEFDVYEPVAAQEDTFSEQGGAIAVGANAIVLANDPDGGDPIEGVRGPIEAAAGDRERAAERDDDFEWMLGRAGHGNAVFGGYGEFEDETDEVNPDSGDDPFSELDGAEGLVSSLTIESETEWTGTFAAAFDELDADAEAELETKLGASADEVSHQFEDTRVTVSATWNENVMNN